MPCEGGFVADGSLDLDDLFDAFDLELPDDAEEEELDSVGGLVVALLGHIPSQGEQVQVRYGGLVFEPVVIGERRVEKVRCTRAPQEEPELPPAFRPDSD